MEKYPIYNCHTHSFNLNHVHNKFLKGMLVFNLWIPISFLRNSGLFRWVIRKLENGKRPVLRRLAYFILHAYKPKLKKVKSQKEIISDLKSYYPSDTKFLIHTMDLDFMVDGEKNKRSRYYDQLHDFVKIKQTKTNQDVVFPFIHADPRRLEKYPLYIKRMYLYLKKGVFSGIKMYPALGYFPFDKRLKPVYDIALEFNLPIMTHCCNGPVYFRGKKKLFKNADFYKDGKFVHPKTGKELPGKKPKDFTQHFSHPLNYACLFDAEFISAYWGISFEEAQKYRNLKICLGHYGGSDEWIRYLTFPWSPHRVSPINLKHWNHTIERSGFRYRLSNYFFPKEPDRRPSWYSIISEMLVKYPNLYADISSSLSDAEMDSLLKVILTTNKDLRKKILFGTDFYMVSTSGAERELSVRVRAYLGEDLFKVIAHDNPKDYLKNKITAEPGEH